MSKRDTKMIMIRSNPFWNGAPYYGPLMKLENGYATFLAFTFVDYAHMGFFTKTPETGWKFRRANWPDGGSHSW